MADGYHHSALQPGFRLREWVIDDVLGSGGFAIVYRGTGVYFSEPVAIKEYFPGDLAVRLDVTTISPSSKGNEEFFQYGLEKFIQEAQILWSLSKPERHPNLLGVRGLFEAHGTAYMIMDFEQGRPLSQILRGGATYDDHSLWAIMGPVIHGLQRAHKAGVLHRDIKPANILIHDDGRPVLIDFGAARSEASQLTSKMAVYTPGYSAIEQQVSSESHGAWTDIYGLAATLYQCMTGKMPPSAVERSMAKEALLVWPQGLQGYSPGFVDFVAAGLALRPADRPQTLDAWLALMPDMFSAQSLDSTVRLQRSLVSRISKPVPAAVATPVPLAQTASDEDADADETGRRPSWHYAAGAGALALILGGAGGYALFGRPSPPPAFVPDSQTAATVAPETTSAGETPAPTMLIPQTGPQTGPHTGPQTGQQTGPAMQPDADSLLPPEDDTSALPARPAAMREQAQPLPAPVLASLPDRTFTPIPAPSPAPSVIPALPPAADTVSSAQLPADPARALQMAEQSTRTTKEQAWATYGGIARSRASLGDITRAQMLFVGIRDDRAALEKMQRAKTRTNAGDLPRLAGQARLLIDRMNRRLAEMEKLADAAPPANTDYASLQQPQSPWQSGTGTAARDPQAERKAHNFPSMLMKLDDLASLPPLERTYRTNAAQEVLLMADMANLKEEADTSTMAPATKQAVQAAARQFYSVLDRWQQKQQKQIAQPAALAADSTTVLARLSGIMTTARTQLLADKTYDPKNAVRAGLVAAGNTRRLAATTDLLARLVADTRHIALFAASAGIPKDTLMYIEEDAGSAMFGLIRWRQEANRSTLSDPELRKLVSYRIDLAYEDREEARNKARQANVPVPD